MWQQPLVNVLVLKSLPPQNYVRLNRWPFYLSWFLSFGMIIAMGCSERLRKKYPINYLFLVRRAAAPCAWPVFPRHCELAKCVCSTPSGSAPLHGPRSPCFEASMDHVDGP